MKKQIRIFKRLELQISLLTYFSLVMLAAVVFRGVQLAHLQKIDELWKLIAYASPLCAAILAARIANRAIVNDDLNRGNERRLEAVQMTHHLIVITQDMEGRVFSMLNTLRQGQRPLFLLPSLAKTIEERYEVLLERSPYKYLPGDCVDLITHMSGSIFGLARFADGIANSVPNANPLLSLPAFQGLDNQEWTKPFDKLLQDLKTLIDRLFEIRKSIDDD